MLKLMMMLVFTLIFSMKKNYFWLIQLVLFFSCFLFILFNNINMYWGMISYFIGYDLISYGMILLSLWISGLMLMASEKIFFF